MKIIDKIEKISTKLTPSFKLLNIPTIKIIIVIKTTEMGITSYILFFNKNFIEIDIVIMIKKNNKYAICITSSLLLILLYNSFFYNKNCF